MNANQPLKGPVCGMNVTPQAPHVLHHHGAPFYFCGAGCRAKFLANPGHYLVSPPAARAANAN